MRVVENALVAAAPPSVNTFAAAFSTPLMNTARYGATATLLPNGQVMIAGGLGCRTSFGEPCTFPAALSSTELYNPVTNAFAAPVSTPLMNTARENATATLLPNGKVLIAGGDVGVVGSGLGSTELYDPLSNTFAASTPVMNATRTQATATLLPNGQVMIAGGLSDLDGVELSSTELYNPATNTFAAAASTPVMNTARWGATATLLPNGEVLIAGGGNESPLGTELYDPATNTFAASASPPVVDLESATATLLPNGQVLIAGGYSDGYLSSTELYNPATNTFAASAPSMNTARYLDTATLLPNGKVLIAGGSGRRCRVRVRIPTSSRVPPPRSHPPHLLLSLGAEPVLSEAEGGLPWPLARLASIKKGKHGAPAAGAARDNGARP